MQKIGGYHYEGFYYDVTTVDKMSTVANEDLLRDKLKLLITPGQQSVYLSLYKLASKDTTDWIGYGTLQVDFRLF
ncbi:MAG: hypothetical protein KAJ14_02320 [Candidatus Omnitrophica bacterium]|nr:hypothetical protein [Candidatus Omnitrophota bacterium]